MENVVTIDFETEAIEDRPNYPPEPVGVAIKLQDAPGEYLAWGHPSGNNVSRAEAVARLGMIWDSGRPLLFHNAKFDIEVAERKLGLPRPDWRRVHDTQFLVYLYDVHAKRFGLKPSAERILGWESEEQDAVADWVVRNVPGATRKTAGAHISKAPVDLVGPYAVGDVDRTFGLFSPLMDYMTQHDCTDAYNRERRLMYHCMDAERHGIRLNMARLEEDIERYERAYELSDNLLREELGDINFNSGQQLAGALFSTGAVQDLPRTSKGAYSTSKDALEANVERPELLHLLRYRGVLKTCLGTFLRPWAASGSRANGRIHTQWHQTRGDADKGGTVTGRMSSTRPNFMNVPNDFDGVETPMNFPPLPHCREYLLPEEGHVWVKRDYSAQEVRLLAHFEEGALMKAFQEDVHLDPHAFAASLIRDKTGHRLERSQTKIIAFSMLYGSGVKHLSEQLKTGRYEASMLRETYLGTFPGVRELMRDVKLRGKNGLPVRTIGGRLLYAEPPRGGRDFSYKLLNHLIQGSAGDVTKEAVIRFSEGCKSSHFLAQVHDEINASVPAEDWKSEMQRLRDTMESVECDVKLLTEGYKGDTWHDADIHKLES